MLSWYYPGLHVHVHVQLAITLWLGLVTLTCTCTCICTCTCTCTCTCSSVGRVPARQSRGFEKFSLFIQNVSKYAPSQYPIYRKSRIPLWYIPLLPLSRLYMYHTVHVHTCTVHVTWAWSLAKGQYMVEWLLTGALPPPLPEQGYWQNRETANIM